MSVAHLRKMISENRVIRQKWTGEDSKGRETACLLASISPEVLKSQSPDSCPASLMPAWLAHLTPWIDDSGTLEHWPVVIQRYASLANEWSVLSEGAWKRAEFRCKRAYLAEAMTHMSDKAVLKVWQDVLNLLDRAIAGVNPPTEKEWAAAAAAEEWAAAAAKAEWAAAAAAEEWAAAAAKAAGDRMIDATLDILEDEIRKAKAA